MAKTASTQSSHSLAITQALRGDYMRLLFTIIIAVRFKTLVPSACKRRCLDPIIQRIDIFEEATSLTGATGHEAFRLKRPRGREL